MSYHRGSMYPKFGTDTEARSIGRTEGAQIREIMRSKMAATGAMVPDNYPGAEALEFTRQHHYEQHGNGREPGSPFYETWRREFDAAYLGH